MQLPRLKLGFAGITDRDLVSFTENVIRSMTDNPNFPNLAPDLKKVQESYLEYQKFNLTRLQRSSQSAKVKNKEKEVLISNLMIMGFGVEHTAAFDTNKLISSGYDLVSESSKAKTPQAVQGVWFGKSAVISELIVQWNKAKYAKSYIVRISTDEKDWKWAVETEGEQANFENMPINVMLFVEVIAKNSKSTADAAGKAMTRL